MNINIENKSGEMIVGGGGGGGVEITSSCMFNAERFY